MPLATTSRAVVPLLALAALSVLVLVALGPVPMPLSGQSPVSPLTPTMPATQQVPAPASPMPNQSPLLPESVTPPAQPAPTPVTGLEWMSSEPFWVSPLPWVALGLVLFSALAWALVSLLHRLDRDA